MPWAILSATVLDLLSMLYRRFDIDYWEGEEVPRRWIAWGTCRAGSPERPHPHIDFRYFVLRLPSYQWGVDWRYDNRSCWHQLTLFRFAGSWKHSGYWLST
jgi:hypothetical protein